MQKPRKRADHVDVADFTMLVRVPGQPHALRVFTDAETDDAHRYAADTGGTIVPLPLSPPSGYANDADGNLIPLPSLPPTCAGIADHPEGHNSAG